MSRSADQWMEDMLAAAARARVAARRLRLAQSLADDTGAQLAFQAIQYNRLVIGEAVRSLPDDVLQSEPAVPWSTWAAFGALDDDGHLTLPAVIASQGGDDFVSLEEAVRRLRSGT